MTNTTTSAMRLAVAGLGTAALLSVPVHADTELTSGSPADALIAKSARAAETVRGDRTRRTLAIALRLQALEGREPKFTSRHERTVKQAHVPDHCFGPSPLTPEETLDLVEQEAERQGVDGRFAIAIARQESRLGRVRVSPVGAMGTMQLMAGTAKEMGVKDPCHPGQNIRGGVRYLKERLDEFGGHRMLAAAAYNAGPGRIHQYQGIPPFAETVNYVAKVMADAEGIDVRFKTVGTSRRAKRAARSVPRTTKAKLRAAPPRQPAKPRTKPNGTWTGGLVQHF